MGLSTQGRKAELVGRLVQHDEERLKNLNPISNKLRDFKIVLKPLNQTILNAILNTGSVSLSQLQVFEDGHVRNQTKAIDDDSGQNFIQTVKRHRIDDSCTDPNKAHKTNKRTKPVPVDEDTSPSPVDNQSLKNNVTLIQKVETVPVDESTSPRAVNNQTALIGRVLRTHVRNQTKAINNTEGSLILTVKRRRVDDNSSTISQKPSRRSSMNNNKRKVVSSVVSLMPSLRQYEIVWAKVRGFCFWPGIIEEETPKGKYKIHFFGDYTTSEVTRNKIIHFLEGFNSYSTDSTINKKLVKAVEECKIFLFDKNVNGLCFICRMIELKKKLIQNN